MNQGPIIIGGFGRSGTTWLSDIISKILGGLILFEPFHPAVFDRAHEFCYHSTSENKDALIDQWGACQHSLLQNPWLIRNHLNDPLEDCSEAFIQYIWSQSRIIGFKTIRCNHLLSFFQEKLMARLIYVHRHPLAVLTSINNRPNFWKEFGWQWHINTFLERTVHPGNFHNYELKHLRLLIERVKDKDALIVLMWSISFLLSIRQVRRSVAHIVSYEQLYMDPFKEVREMLIYLGEENLGIHPSHLFTPSMTTLNTLHHHLGIKTLTRLELDNLFWKNYIDPLVSTTLLSLISKVLEIDEFAYSLAIKSKYLMRK